MYVVIKNLMKQIKEEEKLHYVLIIHH